jgi:hypothetical protein
LRKLILKYYRERVSSSQAPQALKEAIKHEERLPNFLERVERELMEVGRRFGSLPENRIKETVDFLTDIFIHRIMQEADQRSESVLERIRRDEDRRKLEQLKKAAEGEMTDEFLEAGLEIKENE